MTYYYRKGGKYSINNKMLSRAVNIVHCITKKSAVYITVIYHASDRKGHMNFFNVVCHHKLFQKSSPLKQQYCTKLAWQ
jgi:hypothetical protein